MVSAAASESAWYPGVGLAACAGLEGIGLPRTGLTSIAASSSGLVAGLAGAGAGSVAR